MSNNVLVGMAIVGKETILFSQPSILSHYQPSYSFALSVAVCIVKVQRWNNYKFNKQQFLQQNMYQESRLILLHVMYDYNNNNTASQRLMSLQIPYMRND